AMMAHDGTEATEAWLKGVKANLAREPEGNDRAQVKAIWAGVCDISLGNTYYMGAMLDDPEQTDWANAVRIEFPGFADGSGTHVNVSGVAMTASAPNREAAIAFMEYLASPEAQGAYAAVVNEYPARPDARISDRVAAWGAFKADTESLAAIAANRSEALKLVERVDFDGAPGSDGGSSRNARRSGRGTLSPAPPGIFEAR
ncbi:MAG: extracellular solute-binding protein, partial [Silicimonas sp.]|nr:extracellular solute-binding protein [Silicimonas sp.]